MTDPPSEPRHEDDESWALAGLEADAPLGRLVVEETEALPAAEGAIQSGKLAGRGMWASIWILAMPVLLQQLMQAFVGMVDKLLAGQLPAGIRVAALDAIGIGSYVGWFIGIAMAGLGIGGQALIARAMGAGDRATSHRALGQAMGLSMGWGVLVSAGLWASAPPLAAACGLTDTAAGYYADYIRTVALSMPAAGVMLVGAMCLHGAGETTKPSLIAIAVNFANMVLSWALCGADLRFGESFVLENPFSFDLHVTGIALGTALAYGVGAVLTLVVLARGVRDLRLERAELVPDVAMVRRIVRIGVPNFLEGISMWAVNLIVLVFIGRIAAASDNGEGLQGAHIIAIQWEAFSFLPGFAIGTAAGALAGQHLGAGNARNARRSVVACTVLGAIVMGSLGVVFILFGETLTAIISREPVHLEHTPRLLAICGYVQIFFAMAMVIRQGLRGVGDTRWTFIITTVSSYAVRMPAAYILGVHYELGIEGIWLGLCGEFVVRGLLFLARFLHGGWQRIEV